MQVRTIYLISLTFEEAVSLKRLIGDYTYKGKRDLGLSDNMCVKMTELLNELPDTDK